MKCGMLRASIAVLLIPLCGIAGAQTFIGSAFTYQGKLDVAGEPANGLYSFQFGLYDAYDAGNQLGTTVSRICTITSGSLTTSVDFGAGLFDGNKRWVQVCVNSGGSWIALTPRAEILPVPHVGYAASVAHATTATKAEMAGIADTVSTAANVTSADVADELLWQFVTTNTVAQANYRYLVNSPALVTITLPSGAAPGDTVEVNSVGSGGWKLAQLGGHKIRTRPLGIPPDRANWTATGLTKYWRAIASSADGVRLAAAACPGGSDKLYTSLDGGANWISTGYNASWRAIVCSADGTKIVACGLATPMFVSSNFGSTWADRGPTLDWVGIAGSTDLSKLIACGNANNLYTSDDGGTTWTARDSSRNWRAVASSADGSKLAACVGSGQIYTSWDSGVSWTARETTRTWIAITSSRDGSKLAACVDAGMIYMSTDYGQSWTDRAAARPWRAIASSADGTRLAACAAGDQIYLSNDSGTTWKAAESLRQWNAIACSADGEYLVAGVYNGRTYQCPFATTTGTAGYLLCQGTGAIEVQYVGGLTWVPLKHEGEFESH